MLTKRFFFLSRILFWITGCALLVILFWNVSESQSQFFLGYSKIRWLTGIYILAVLFAFSVITNEKNITKRNVVLHKSHLIKILFLLYAFVLLGSIFYLLYTKNSYLNRVVWILIWNLLGVSVIIGYWNKSFLDTIQKIKNCQAVPTKSLSFISITLAFIWFLLNLYLFFYGQPNADEGWYLFASKLVYKGYIPYRDFAYTQMPLLPYIYGIPQLLYPSYITGRLTSFFFSVISYIVSWLIAKQISGKSGTIAVQIMLLLYPTVIFFGVIVKTYALVSTFMLLTLFFIIQEKRNCSYFALVSAMVPGFVRLSALPFSTIMTTYILFTAKHKGRSSFYKHLFILFITSIPLLVLMTTNINATIWNVFSFHMSSGNAVSGGSELIHLFGERLPKMFKSWAYLKDVILLTLLPTILILFKKKRIKIKHQNELFIFGIAIFFFSAFNLISGIFLYEYLVPSFIPLIVIIVSISVFIFKIWQPTRIYQYIPHLLLLFLLLQSIPSTWQYITFYTEKCTSCNVIFDTYSAGKTVKKYSSEDEPVFALSNLYVAVEANRNVHPIFSMAQFSITGLDDTQAHFFNVANSDLLFQYLEKERPKLLILSLSEKEMLEKHLGKSFFNAYSTKLFLEQFGQKATPLYILVRTEKD